ncbi:protein of unknown function [Methylocella tundrae]|uniref:Uncharacterized protein n=1 Tax=Methylocella tundrae TaxID=227605 RepID=A0A4U8Z2Q2_METTU|nr:protein of unknown function [Methylocella tundrae]
MKSADAGAAPVQFPGHVHEAAEIAAKKQVGFRRFDVFFAFASTIAFEIDGYLTQNVPPKPQQD